MMQDSRWTFITFEDLLFVSNEIWEWEREELKEESDEGGEIEDKKSEPLDWNINALD